LMIWFAPNVDPSSETAPVASVNLGDPSIRARGRGLSVDESQSESV